MSSEVISIPPFREVEFFSSHAYVLAPSVILWSFEDDIVLAWLRETYPDRYDWDFVAARSAFCTNDKDLAMAFKLRWG